MMNIVELPELVLLHIAHDLCAEDIIHLSQTCTRMHSVLPRFLLIRGQNFSIPGPNSGHWEPEPYFDGPLLKHRVRKLTMSVKWKDQGYGNRKGEIFMQLMRGREMVAEKRAVFGVAKHKEELVKAVLTDHDVVTRAESGDFYRFMRNAGGGGGHSLTVKDFRVQIDYSSHLQK